MRYILTMILLIIIIGCSSTTPIVNDTNPRVDALVVGVGEYKNRIKPLYGVKNDLKNIQKLLRYFNINHITTLQNTQATLQDIRKTFYNYIHSNKNRKNNIFLFYYSGHGIQVIDRSGDEKDKKDEATALYDIALNSKGLITDGVLLDDEFHYILSQIKSKKIIIFDKCHSGSSHREIFKPFVKSISGEYNLSSDFLDSLNRYTKNKQKLNDYIIFSATTDNQEAEDSPIGGLFTNSLIDGIINKKADINHNNQITISELKEFCTTNIPNLATNISQEYNISLKGEFSPYFIPKEARDRTIRSIFSLKSK